MWWWGTCKANGRKDAYGKFTKQDLELDRPGDESQQSLQVSYANSKNGVQASEKERALWGEKEAMGGRAGKAQDLTWRQVL